jgi:integrase/recombinase XerD
VKESKSGNKDRPVSIDKTLKEVSDFVTHMLSNKMSKNTIENYKRYVIQMMLWLEKKPKDIKKEDLERYKTHMSIEKKYSKGSMYIHIKGIQAFFEFLKMDIARELKPPKRAESLPKYLSEEEMAKIFEVAKRDKTNGLRDYAILTVLGYTGLRVNELCSLNAEDIDFNEKTIKVTMGKGDKDRIVIFEEKTEEALKNHLVDITRYISKSEPSALFVTAQCKRILPRSVELLVHKYAEEAGIHKKVTPHVFRHTMATMLLKHGADIRIIQQLLGHASIATTQIYTHVDEGMLKKAYDKSKPEYK